MWTFRNWFKNYLQEILRLKSITTPQQDFKWTTSYHCPPPPQPNELYAVTTPSVNWDFFPPLTPDVQLEKSIGHHHHSTTYQHYGHLLSPLVSHEW